jgi:hypothetical protein
MSNRDGNELFRSAVECAVSEDGVAEVLERLVNTRGELPTQGGQLGRGWVIHGVSH